MTANSQPTALVYIDAVQVWLEHPLSSKQIAWLSDQCGSPLLEPPFKIDEPMRYQPSLKQGFRLTQPSLGALNWLAGRDDALLTYGEFAFDCGDAELSEALPEIFRLHFVQRWHRGRQTRVFENGNILTGERGRRGTAFCGYDDRPSKVTKKMCFHIEARVQGSATLRRIGIQHPRDLLSFDYASFIHRQLNGTFFECNLGKLGRYVANKRDGTKRRKPVVRSSKRRPSFDYDIDAATGNILLRSLGIQGVVDTYGRGRYLSPLLCLCARSHHSERRPTSAHDSQHSTHRCTHCLIQAYLQSLSNVQLRFCP